MSDIDYDTATYTGTVTIDAEALFLMTISARTLASQGLPGINRDEYLSLYKQGMDAIVNGLCDGTVTLA